MFYAISRITCHGSPHHRLLLAANVQGIIINSTLDDSKFMKYEDEKCSGHWHVLLS
ncbi:hypothetical protein FIBSPDRAFT_872213, partial [Athelia psychrophila]